MTEQVSDVEGLVARLKKVRTGFVTEEDFDRREAADAIETLSRKHAEDAKLKLDFVAAMTDAEDRMIEDAKLLEQVVTLGIGAGLFDDDTPLWRELARITSRNPDTGNRL